MGHQLSTFLHRLGAGRGWVSEAARPAPEDPVVTEAQRVRRVLSAAEDLALDGWLAERPAAAPLLTRALAAWGAPGPVAALAAAWDGWDADTRTAVAEPARHLVGAARQTDGTTCGSASLVLLAACGDPLLAAWLATGRLVGGHRPVDLGTAPPAALAALADRPAADRFGALQQVVHRRSTARGLGPWPWPLALGTPPWGAAREARFPGVRYGHAVIDDADPRLVAAALGRVAAWVAAGVPVPLYAGGDSGRGWATAAPRHVVLAVGAVPGGLEVVEPSAGRRLVLPDGSTGRREALGGWSHVTWAVLPAPR